MGNSGVPRCEGRGLDMVFDRPKKPGTGKPSPLSRPGSQKPSGKPKKVITVGANRGGSGSGGSGSGGGGGRNDGNGDTPSPWLQHPLDLHPEPAPTASFVEYLRWMRPPDSEYKDPTKVQILQMAEKSANYRDRLTTLTDRTKLIAGEENTFQARCLWRIRVGGHRGPESMLLPAFDALGMPYIPSSTLRGVARNQAIHEQMEEGLSWAEAARSVSAYFGSIEETNENRLCKVIFLDAYPLPQQDSDSGGLSVDIATAIWKWDGSFPKYDEPKPNTFFSLEKAIFLVGVRPISNIHPEVLNQVKQWLIRGLESGIGSQVNTGYGSLVVAQESVDKDELFRVNFELKGQLIHGRQKFRDVDVPFQMDRDGGFRTDRRGNLKVDSSAHAEVRPVAFKSMLRYWFRVFALGFLPSREVQRLEGELFGAINPQPVRGKIAVRISNGEVVQKEPRANWKGKDEPVGRQSGRLILAYSSEAPANQRRDIETLMSNLTWMMFHLGGIGQGARRPCYSRKSRERAPWWRGSTLIPDTEDSFWNLPSNVKGFQELFRRRSQAFYEALGRLADRPINPRQPLAAGRVSGDRWVEAVDANCRLLVCQGDEDFGKPYPLAILHSEEFKVRDRRGQKDYDGNLCGQVRGGVKPSPVWIADLGDYQVVTVFGATQDPRQQYVRELRRRTDRNDYAQIWPLQ